MNPLVALDAGPDRRYHGELYHLRVNFRISVLNAIRSGADLHHSLFVRSRLHSRCQVLGQLSFV